MPAKWNLKGTYLETCNCDAACPCVFMSDPTQGECTVLVGWHIERGSFDGKSLDGLNAALAVHTPGNMAKTKWKAALYLDDRATEEQRTALGRIFSGQEGGHPAVLTSFIGEVLGVKSVPIEYRNDGKRRGMRLEGVAEADIEAMTGAGDAEVSISGHPLCIAPGYPVTVAKSHKLSYRDYDMEWELSDKTAFFSPFSYQGS